MNNELIINGVKYQSINFIKNGLDKLEKELKNFNIIIPNKYNPIIENDKIIIGNIINDELEFKKFINDIIDYNYKFNENYETEFEWIEDGLLDFNNKIEINYNGFLISYEIKSCDFHIIHHINL